MTTQKNSGQFLFNQEPVAQTEKQATIGKPRDFEPKEATRSGAFVPRSLFEYMMGIKEIAVQYDNYQETQALVTQPMEVIGNVREIELSTKENHPVFDLVGQVTSQRRTAIEYYISFTDNPSPVDWVPILPKEEKQVWCERLFLVSGQAQLRFPAKMETLVVYKNGIILKPEHYLVIESRKLAIKQVDFSAIYTVDYLPDTKIHDPWKIQLEDYKQKVQRQVETFPGTAYNKTLTLSHYPYVDYEKIHQTEDYNPNTSDYQPIQVSLKNASLRGKNNTRLQSVFPYKVGQETFTYNKTLYKDKSWSELQPYSLDKEQTYQGFDYYHWKNKLVFTETFNASQLAVNRKETSGVADIEVAYDFLVSSFRLKAIFRRNSPTDVAVTPELLNYTLLFKTEK